jgi:hypothetical protein
VKHLDRYLSEFDFRYSNRVALGVNDGERADLAIKGTAGKRLTYRQPHKIRFQPIRASWERIESQGIPKSGGT